KPIEPGIGSPLEKKSTVRPSRRPRAPQEPAKVRCRVASAQGGLAMEVRSLEGLGDEIAELSAHLDAATARLLDLIRDFDARKGWGNGFRSCAAWLTWRIGLDPGAARGALSYAKVRALTRGATPEAEERLLGGGPA